LKEPEEHKDGASGIVGWGERTAGTKEITL